MVSGGLGNMAIEAARGYEDVPRLRRGERVAPTALPGIDLPVDGILG
jgi:hypothetical protein